MVSRFQLLPSFPRIISQKKQPNHPPLSLADQLEPAVRRSSRPRRQPKNEDYFMGTSHIEELLGNACFEEELAPKRRRNYRADDSEDYSQGHKYAKKSRVMNANKVERLLQWKLQLFLHPITVNYLSQEQPLTPVEDLHRVRTTKQLAKHNLAAFAEDVQAIFINIDWGKPGQTMKDFKQLSLQQSKLMSKGLVFVWAPKELLSQLLSTMQLKNFTYVQNLEIINLDFQKAKRLAFDPPNGKSTQAQTELDIWHVVKNIGHVNPADLIVGEPSEYFNRGKRTLLMFKKNNNAKFELRHQRTCDVVFDMPLRPGRKCESDLKAYIYLMIETLLPDCLLVDQKKKHDFGFKMLELWADKGACRRGWVSVVEE